MANATKATIDRGEAEHFGRLAADWWNPKGSSAMLHRLNPMRLRFLREVLQLRPAAHVLEAPDPAQAIIEFARRNQADHIVMGARGSSGFRRYLGSVSTEVTSQAECSVTVVRAPARSK